MTRLTILSAALITSVAPVARAEAPLDVSEAPHAAMSETDRGASSTAARDRATHDAFLLRVSAGFGAVGAGIETQAGPERGVGGAGPTLNLLVGAAVSPNWALHADFQAMGADYARVGVDGEKGTKHVSGLGLLAGGVGATYFIRPYDVSLSASVLYAALGFDAPDGYSYSSDRVALGKIDITKEWAVSDTWGMGLGLSAFAGYARGVDSEHFKSDTNIAGVSLNAVATYL